MKILSAEQTRKADLFTIENEPITSIDLMERAAEACINPIVEIFKQQKFNKITIFCGMGNNGGDGLAIARLLLLKQLPTVIYIAQHKQRGSADFEKNLNRLKKITDTIFEIDEASPLPEIHTNELIIDALLGTGINHPLKGLLLQIAQHINTQNKVVIAIDVPSGLFCESNKNNQLKHVIKATYTLTFQSPKLSFLLPDSGSLVGKFIVLDISLAPVFLDQLIVDYNYTDLINITSSFPPREKFAYKNNFGHALFIGGSPGRVGALYLSCKAALRSGVGLCSALPPKKSAPILQMQLPEAMIAPSKWSPSISAIGIGPGLGTNKWAEKQLLKVLNSKKTPRVIDADAITLISENKKFLHEIEGCVLTPHVGEFERLVQTKFKDAFSRMEAAIAFATTYKVYLILKGGHTLVATPEGKVFFNSTGNPVLARGGSGDILTGILTALLARNTPTLEACKTAVWLHGKSGEMAALKYGVESVLASEIIESLQIVLQKELTTD